MRSIDLPCRVALLLALLLGAPARAADEHSHARVDDVRVAALHLDLRVDFERRELAGFAELALVWRNPAARELVLDTRELTIERVLGRGRGRGRDGRWRAVAFSLGAADPVLGRPLVVVLPRREERVRVHYRTAPGATALQWLEPTQTRDGTQPFLIAHSQFLHARSWVPLQDTPAIRFPYTARIDAPAGVRVLMAAPNDPTATGADGWRFAMMRPIPSYLLALAVGHVEYRPLGPRSGVYAEPSLVDAAARELADVERLIGAAEALYGPYRFGRYDVLVPPAAFPWSGLEIPCLTLFHPTLVTGDQSFVPTLAHELAHSWSGNLVTNAAWRDFWLNEGVTTYVEYRLVEAVFGAQVAATLVAGDQASLRQLLPAIPAADQRLRPDLRGRDPDATFSRVPYVKGAWLLRTLEARLGRAAFDRMLRAWFDEHAFASADSDAFLAAYVRAAAGVPGAPARTDVARWLDEPGIPSDAAGVESARLRAIESVRDSWLAGRVASAALPATAWDSLDWQHFLWTLPPDVPAARLAELDGVWRLGAQTNPRALRAWFRAAIRAGHTAVRPALREALRATGNLYFIVPLFRALAARPSDRAWARALYEQELRARYGAMTRAQVEPLLAPR